ncbi:MAG: AAA family ATPase [Acidobacteria bacterium]|nr:AAA family ATPase [Acidobacteriota bacterium]
MKIRRLDLIAYGPFSNEALDFGTDNLHVIYGPNEAGKSTALRALQSVLYGMTERRDAFLHSWDMMRVGMSAELGNEVVRVERRKGKGARSLVHTGTDRAVTGEEWNRVLPVLDQELFLQMFGLDYQRLVEGGRELASGKGDIGQALLAAAGDLGVSVERMRSCESKSAELFQPHARSQSKLAVALRQYKDADKRIRSEKFSSHAYRNAVLEQEERQREIERLGSEIRACGVRHSTLTRLRQASPAVALLLQKESALASMSEIPDLTADFAARYQEVLKLRDKASTTTDNCQSELDRLTQKLAETKLDPTLAGLQIETETLFAQSGKIEAGRQHRPKREGELQQVRERAVRNLRQLALDLDPSKGADRRVRIVQRNEIKRLANEHPKLTTRLSEAANSIEKLSVALEANKEQLRNLPVARDTAEIESCLAASASAQSEKELTKTRTTLREAEMRADTALRALPLFAGGAAEIQRLPAPPLTATVRGFEARFAQQGAAEQQHESSEVSAQTEIASLERKLRELEDRCEVPTESDLQAKRARRDLGWCAVKNRWLENQTSSIAEADFLANARSDQPLAAAYEDAVQFADEVGDQMRTDAASVQKKVLYLDQIAQSTERLKEARNAKEAAYRARQELNAEWTLLWEPTLSRPGTPAEMLEWLEKRRNVVEVIEHAAELRRALTEAEGQIQTWRDSLSAALLAFGETAGGTLGQLAQRAQSIVQVENETRSRRRELERDQRRLESERKKAEEHKANVEGALGQWDRDWAEAVKGLPVPGGATPDTVQEVVRLLDEVATDADQINGLVHRIETMERDEKEFSASVKRLAVLAGVALDVPDALAAIRKLNQAATTAKQSHDTAMSLQGDIERTSNHLHDAKVEAERQEKALASLCVEAGVTRPDLLHTVIENSAKKRELIGQIADQREALTGACAGHSLEELVEAVGELNIDAIPGQLAEIEAQQQQYEVQRQECARRILELESEFQVHECAANLNQAAAEKQEAGARILDYAEQYLEQEVAARLLGAAIERYRMRHQDPLLERAGEHLRTLTCGSFSGLAVDFVEGNRRVLRAVRRDSGEHLDVAGLSDGARDQLFLALRLAYIEDHCTRIGMCPVILDDILMAFDNERAAAALKCLAELATRTQVLLFTHHLHHTELARQVLKAEAFSIHELGAKRPAVA